MANVIRKPENFQRCYSILSTDQYSLTVRPNVSRSPERHTLNMQVPSNNLTTITTCDTVQPEQYLWRKCGLNTHPNN